MNNERILVVDDEDTVRRVVMALLEHSGYSTLGADSAAHALKLLEQDPDCLVVMSDVMMPGTDGLALLDSIMLDHPATPVILFTALHDLRVVTDAFRRGAFDYLLKPFERKDLVDTVQRAVAQARTRRQSHQDLQQLEEVVTERTQRLRSAMSDLEENYDVTLEAMGTAVDLRDQGSAGHSRRVTAYCIALAQALGLQGSTLKTLARGAFLHDIGKLATPDAILLKPGALTPPEQQVMREHSQRGYDIVRRIPFLSEASEIVLAHQERFDGTGYPRGLSGTEIPVGARIFAIADTLDAITSDRPYRKGESFAEARAEIARCAGQQFDPEIVAAFLSLPVELWEDLRAGVALASNAN